MAIPTHSIPNLEILLFSLFTDKNIPKYARNVYFAAFNMIVPLPDQYKMTANPATPFEAYTAKMNCLDLVAELNLPPKIVTSAKSVPTSTALPPSSPPLTLQVHSEKDEAPPEIIPDHKEQESEKLALKIAAEESDRFENIQSDKKLALTLSKVNFLDESDPDDLGEPLRPSRYQDYSDEDIDHLLNKMQFVEDDFSTLFRTCWQDNEWHNFDFGWLTPKSQRELSVAFILDDPDLDRLKKAIRANETASIKRGSASNSKISNGKRLSSQFLDNKKKMAPSLNNFAPSVKFDLEDQKSKSPPTSQSSRKLVNGNAETINNNQREQKKELKPETPAKTQVGTNNNNGKDTIAEKLKQLRGSVNKSSSKD